MKNKSIIIVEDHTALRMSLSSWIGELFPSLEIHNAASGEEALDIAEYFNVDFAIVDIGLPGMDGFEVTKILKNNNPNSEVVILSIYDGRKYTEESNRVGAAAFINKKDMLSKLPRVLTTLLDGKN